MAAPLDAPAATTGVSRAVVVALITVATFTDILAYSIAVPVLPDISRRFGASPTVIGLLFASFGLTVLLTSVPMGAVSDRPGRRLPLVGGLVALAAASVLFAFAPGLSWLFAARLTQGAADAITWVVGFAVVADLYNADERGRVIGLVMSGSTAAFLVGPTIGGWLYQTGGPALPYLVVAGLAVITAVGLLLVPLPAHPEAPETTPVLTIATQRPVVICAIAVIVGGGTIAMLEPVLALHFAAALGLGPARIGLVFGVAALVAAVLHPVFGRVADRVGGRTMTLSGLCAIGLALPVLSIIGGLVSAFVVYGAFVVTISMMVAPSLAYMGEAVSHDGRQSFGVAYGLYNCAWAIGLLIGPSVGAAVYERVGFATLVWAWAPFTVVVAGWLWRASTPATVAP